MAASDADDLVGKLPVKKRKPGRPAMEMTEEIVSAICERLALGESLRSICADPLLPSQPTVFKWLANSPEFALRYARAREAQADAIFDEILDIADDGSNDWMEARDKDGAFIGWKENGEALQRSRLRIDARKWMAAKLKPTKYGEKILHGEDADNPLSKGTVEIDVFKLADQMREAKRLAAQEPIAIEGKKAP